MTDKKTLMIDGKEVEFTDEPNLLEVIRHAGLNVPTFCYRPDLTQFGACRMCVVEVEYPNGRTMINSSCTMPPECGINVKLNTQRVRRIRKTVLELLLANHDKECLTCEKSGSCELQKYSEEYGIKKIRYPEKPIEEYLPIDDSSPSIVRDPNKCILCGACVRACTEFQGHSVLGFANRGSKTVIQPMAGKPLGQVDCVNCGQCAAVCPTGALTIKTCIDDVWSEINNPEKKTVVQIAPSVRVALGEMFGLKPGENTIGKIYAALRRIGFDFIYDTNFGADMTILEEAHEFVERLTKGENLPLFTSCCPAWVKYLEDQHPDMLSHLSTCSSPMSMQSPVMGKLVPEKLGCTRDDISVIAIMPCTAKKFEIIRSEHSRDGHQDTDHVLTTQELGRMIRAAGIDFDKLEPEQPDSPYAEYTGAGTIFGASGGVAEAAVRTAYKYATGEELKDMDIKELRGTTNRSKSVQLDIKGTKVIVRVVSTLKEAEKAIKEIKDGTANFQMLEVMACPGGCINGGGQPLSYDNSNIKCERAQGLYKEDKELAERRSHDNKSLQKLYDEYLECPGSHKAHELLHTTYIDRFQYSYKNMNQ
ncbi:MAG: [FeFe] hydrogenase, group A [Clostridiaceae bacterium]|jgi:NADH-quinone oxidoreductase subunit G|nr:[FeFe] hydrogenase, group A [Clostridiaceae bacterium]